MVVGGGWGEVCKVIFMSNPIVVLRLGWGFDNVKNCLVGYDHIKYLAKNLFSYLCFISY